MRRLRIEQLGDAFGIDVVCDCGQNGLTNVETGEADFKHKVELGGPDVILGCGCGTKIVIHPQETHFHVLQT
jgi:hypothetical protein